MKLVESMTQAKPSVISVMSTIHPTTQHVSMHAIPDGKDFTQQTKEEATPQTTDTGSNTAIIGKKDIGNNTSHITKATTEVQTVPRPILKNTGAQISTVGIAAASMTILEVKDGNTSPVYQQNVTRDTQYEIFTVSSSMNTAKVEKKDHKAYVDMSPVVETHVADKDVQVNITPENRENGTNTYIPETKDSGIQPQVESKNVATNTTTVKLVESTAQVQPSMKSTKSTVYPSTKHVSVHAFPIGKDFTHQVEMTPVFSPSFIDEGVQVQIITETDESGTNTYVNETKDSGVQIKASVSESHTTMDKITTNDVGVSVDTSSKKQVVSYYLSQLQKKPKVQASSTQCDLLTAPKVTDFSQQASIEAPTPKMVDLATNTTFILKRDTANNTSPLPVLASRGSQITAVTSTASVSVRPSVQEETTLTSAINTHNRSVNTEHIEKRDQISSVDIPVSTETEEIVKQENAHDQFAPPMFSIETVDAEAQISPEQKDSTTNTKVLPRQKNSSTNTKRVSVRETAAQIQPTVTSQILFVSPNMAHVDVDATVDGKDFAQQVNIEDPAPEKKHVGLNTRIVTHSDAASNTSQFPAKASIGSQTKVDTTSASIAAIPLIADNSTEIKQLVTDESTFTLELQTYAREVQHQASAIHVSMNTEEIVKQASSVSVEMVREEIIPQVVQPVEFAPHTFASITADASSQINPDQKTSSTNTRTIHLKDSASEMSVTRMTSSGTQVQNDQRDVSSNTERAEFHDSTCQIQPEMMSKIASACPIVENVSTSARVDERDIIHQIPFEEAVPEVIDTGSNTIQFVTKHKASNTILAKRKDGTSNTSPLPERATIASQAGVPTSHLSDAACNTSQFPARTSIGSQTRDATVSASVSAIPLTADNSTEMMQLVTDESTFTLELQKFAKEVQHHVSATHVSMNTEEIVKKESSVSVEMIREEITPQVVQPVEFAPHTFAPITVDAASQISPDQKASSTNTRTIHLKDAVSEMAVKRMTSSATQMQNDQRNMSSNTERTEFHDSTCQIQPEMTPKMATACPIVENVALSAKVEGRDFTHQVSFEEAVLDVMDTGSNTISSVTEHRGTNTMSARRTDGSSNTSPLPKRATIASQVGVATSHSSMTAKPDMKSSSTSPILTRKQDRSSYETYVYDEQIEQIRTSPVESSRETFVKESLIPVQFQQSSFSSKSFAMQSMKNASTEAFTISKDFYQQAETPEVVTEYADAASNTTHMTLVERGSNTSPAPKRAHTASQVTVSSTESSVMTKVDMKVGSTSPILLRKCDQSSNTDNSLSDSTEKASNTRSIALRDGASNTSPLPRRANIGAQVSTNTIDHATSPILTRKKERYTSANLPDVRTEMISKQEVTPVELAPLVFEPDLENTGTQVEPVHMESGTNTRLVLTQDSSSQMEEERYVSTSLTQTEIGTSPTLYKKRSTHSQYLMSSTNVASQVLVERASVQSSAVPSTQESNTIPIRISKYSRHTQYDSCSSDISVNTDNISKSDQASEANLPAPLDDIVKADVQNVEFAAPVLPPALCDSQTQTFSRKVEAGTNTTKQKVQDAKLQALPFTKHIGSNTIRKEITVTSVNTPSIPESVEVASQFYIQTSSAATMAAPVVHHASTEMSPVAKFVIDKSMGTHCVQMDDKACEADISVDEDIAYHEPEIENFPPVLTLSNRDAQIQNSPDLSEISTNTLSPTTVNTHAQCSVPQATVATNTAKKPQVKDSTFQVQPVVSSFSVNVHPDVGEASILASVVGQDFTQQTDDSKPQTRSVKTNTLPKPYQKQSSIQATPRVISVSSIARPFVKSESSVTDKFETRSHSLQTEMFSINHSPDVCLVDSEVQTNPVTIIDFVPVTVDSTVQYETKYFFSGSPVQATAVTADEESSTSVETRSQFVATHTDVTNASVQQVPNTTESFMQTHIEHLEKMTYAQEMKEVEEHGFQTFVDTSTTGLQSSPTMRDEYTHPKADNVHNMQSQVATDMTERASMTEMSLDDIEELLRVAGKDLVETMKYDQAISTQSMHEDFSQGYEFDTEDADIQTMFEAFSRSTSPMLEEMKNIAIQCEKTLEMRDRELEVIPETIEQAINTAREKLYSVFTQYESNTINVASETEKDVKEISTWTPRKRLKDQSTQETKKYQSQRVHAAPDTTEKGTMSLYTTDTAVTNASVQHSPKMTESFIQTQFEQLEKMTYAQDIREVEEHGFQTFVDTSTAGLQSSPTMRDEYTLPKVDNVHNMQTQVATDLTERASMTEMSLDDIEELLRVAGKDLVETMKYDQATTTQSMHEDFSQGYEFDTEDADIQTMFETFSRSTSPMLEEMKNIAIQCEKTLEMRDRELEVIPETIEQAINTAREKLYSVFTQYESNTINVASETEKDVKEISTWTPRKRFKDQSTQETKKYQSQRVHAAPDTTERGTTSLYTQSRTATQTFMTKSSIWTQYDTNLSTSSVQASVSKADQSNQATNEVDEAIKPFEEHFEFSLPAVCSNAEVQTDPVIIKSFCEQDDMETETDVDSGIEVDMQTDPVVVLTEEEYESLITRPFSLEYSSQTPSTDTKTFSHQYNTPSLTERTQTEATEVKSDSTMTERDSTHVHGTQTEIQGRFDIQTPYESKLHFKSTQAVAEGTESFTSMPPVIFRTQHQQTESPISKKESKVVFTPCPKQSDDSVQTTRVELISRALSPRNMSSIAKANQTSGVATTDQGTFPLTRDLRTTKSQTEKVLTRGYAVQHHSRQSAAMTQTEQSKISLSSTGVGTQNDTKEANSFTTQMTTNLGTQTYEEPKLLEVIQPHPVESVFASADISVKPVSITECQTQTDYTPDGEVMSRGSSPVFRKPITLEKSVQQKPTSIEKAMTDQSMQTEVLPVKITEEPVKPIHVKSERMGVRMWALKREVRDSYTQTLPIMKANRQAATGPVMTSDRQSSTSPVMVSDRQAATSPVMMSDRHAATSPVPTSEKSMQHDTYLPTTTQERFVSRFQTALLESADRRDVERSENDGVGSDVISRSFEAKIQVIPPKVTTKDSSMQHACDVPLLNDSICQTDFEDIPFEEIVLVSRVDEENEPLSFLQETAHMSCQTEYTDGVGKNEISTETYSAPMADHSTQSFMQQRHSDSQTITDLIPRASSPLLPLKEESLPLRDAEIQCVKEQNVSMTQTTLETVTKALSPIPPRSKSRETQSSVKELVHRDIQSDVNKEEFSSQTFVPTADYAASPVLPETTSMALQTKQIYTDERITQYESFSSYSISLDRASSPNIDLHEDISTQTKDCAMETVGVQVDEPDLGPIYLNTATYVYDGRERDSKTLIEKNEADHTQSRPIVHDAVQQTIADTEDEATETVRVGFDFAGQAQPVTIEQSTATHTTKMVSNEVQVRMTRPKMPTRHVAVQHSSRPSNTMTQAKPVMINETSFTSTVTKATSAVQYSPPGSAHSSPKQQRKATLHAATSTSEVQRQTTNTQTIQPAQIDSSNQIKPVMRNQASLVQTATDCTDKGSDIKPECSDADSMAAIDQVVTSVQCVAETSDTPSQYDYPEAADISVQVMPTCKDLANSPIFKRREVQVTSTQTDPLFADFSDEEFGEIDYHDMQYGDRASLEEFTWDTYVDSLTEAIERPSVTYEYRLHDRFSDQEDEDSPGVDVSIQMQPTTFEMGAGTPHVWTHDQGNQIYPSQQTHSTQSDFTTKILKHSATQHSISVRDGSSMCDPPVVSTDRGNSPITVHTERSIRNLTEESVSLSTEEMSQSLRSATVERLSAPVVISKSAADEGILMPTHQPMPISHDAILPNILSPAELDPIIVDDVTEVSASPSQQRMSQSLRSFTVDKLRAPVVTSKSVEDEGILTILTPQPTPIIHDAILPNKVLPVEVAPIELNQKAVDSDAESRNLDEKVDTDTKHQIRMEVIDELTAELTTSIHEEVRMKLKEEFDEEVRQTVMEEIREEIYEDYREELMVEFAPILKLEIEEQMRDDLQVTIRQELEPQIRLEITEEYIQERVNELLVETLKFDVPKEPQIEAKPPTVERGTLPMSNTVTDNATQIRVNTAEAGVQITETKPVKIDEICQTQIRQITKGTTTDKSDSKDAKTQVHPTTSDRGTTPVKIAKKNSSSQTGEVGVKDNGIQNIFTPEVVHQSMQVIMRPLQTNQITQVKSDQSSRGTTMKPRVYAPGYTQTHVSSESRVVQASTLKRELGVQSNLRKSVVNNQSQVKPSVTEKDTMYDVKQFSSVSVQSVKKQTRHASAEPDRSIGFVSSAVQPDQSTYVTDHIVQVSPITRDGANSPLHLRGHNTFTQERAVSPIMNYSQRPETAPPGLESLSPHTTDLVNSSASTHAKQLKKITVDLSQTQQTRLRLSNTSPFRLSDTTLSSFSRPHDSEISEPSVTVSNVIMDNMPPNCRMVFVQQTTAGATYTTAMTTQSFTLSSRTTMSSERSQMSYTPLSLLNKPDDDSSELSEPDSLTDSDPIHIDELEKIRRDLRLSRVMVSDDQTTLISYLVDKDQSPGCPEKTHFPMQSRSGVPRYRRKDGSYFEHEQQRSMKDLGRRVPKDESSPFKQSMSFDMKGSPRSPDSKLSSEIPVESSPGQPTASSSGMKPTHIMYRRPRYPSSDSSPMVTRLDELFRKSRPTSYVDYGWIMEKAPEKLKKDEYDLPSVEKLRTRFTKRRDGPPGRPAEDSPSDVESEVSTTDSETDSESWHAVMDLQSPHLHEDPRFWPYQNPRRTPGEASSASSDSEVYDSDDDNQTVCGEVDLNTLRTDAASSKDNNSGDIPRKRRLSSTFSSDLLRKELSLTEVVLPRMPTKLTKYRSKPGGDIRPLSSRRCKSESDLRFVLVSQFLKNNINRRADELQTV